MPSRRGYAQNAYPFNEVRHLDDTKVIFSRMFRQVADPHFHVKEHAEDMRGLFLASDMSFRRNTWRPREMLRGLFG